MVRVDAAVSKRCPTRCSLGNHRGSEGSIPHSDVKTRWGWLVCRSIPVRRTYHLSDSCWHAFSKHEACHRGEDDCSWLSHGLISGVQGDSNDDGGRELA